MAKSNPPCAAEIPWADHVTAYDEAHFAIYLQLLDAEAAGASDAEMAWVILGIDPDAEPERASQALQTHLRRAHWMTETGFRDLLHDS